MTALRNVLIVDDSEIDHITVKYAFEDYDPSITIISAYDGQEALNLLASCEQPPDLILLDINMPGMNGHMFLSKYVEVSAPSSVVIMLTSSDQYEDRKKCEAYDFVKDYITKPLEPEYLDTIDTLLHR